MTVALSPAIRSPSPRKRAEKVLLVGYYDPAGPPTIAEGLGYLAQRSEFSITLLNLHGHRSGARTLTLPHDIDLDAFSAVVIHNTVSYDVANLRSLDRRTALQLAEYDGVKVVFKQDENFRAHEIARYFGATGIDVVFTCLDPADAARVYPPSLSGALRIERMLTGYVSPALRALRMPVAERRVDIGYRGSLQPLSFGRLAYDKRYVGDLVVGLLAGRPLMLDVSSRWEDRLGAQEWLAFLGRCKATLGAESGASIFDLDGSLAQRCARIEAELGPVRDDPVYAEAYLARLADLEGQVSYGQVSPRHFEACATGTLQLLFAGTYSGLLQADRHYLTLRRDGSNLDALVATLLDPVARSRITQCARDEVLGNRAVWIEAFVSRFDAVLAEAIAHKGTRRPQRSRSRWVRHQATVAADRMKYGIAAPAWRLLPLAIRRRLVALWRRLV